MKEVTYCTPFYNEQFDRIALKSPGFGRVEQSDRNLAHLTGHCAQGSFFR
jgi:hypothetical protein